MVRVEGHWRVTGWVRGHLRHPHRPGADQVRLVLLVDSPVRLDPGRYADGGVAPSSPRVPRPRAATDRVRDGRAPAADGGEG